MRQVREPSPEMDVLAKAVIDAAIEVHRALGPGFLESIYEEALAVELTTRQIPFERQKPLLKAMGRQLGLLINFNVPVLRSGIQRVVLS